METLADLLPRFEKVKKNLTEDWAERLLSPPTDKEVWGQMRAVACRNRDEAIADDMQGFVESYDIRIGLIDEQLKQL